MPGRLTLLAAAVTALLLVGAVAVHWLALVAIVSDAIIVGICLLQGSRLRSLAVTVEREAPSQK